MINKKLRIKKRKVWERQEKDSSLNIQGIREHEHSEYANAEFHKENVEF